MARPAVETPAGLAKESVTAFAASACCLGCVALRLALTNTRNPKVNNCRQGFFAIDFDIDLVLANLQESVFVWPLGRHRATTK